MMFRGRFLITALFAVLFESQAAALAFPDDAQSPELRKAVAAYKRAAPGRVFLLLAKPKNADEYCLRGLTHKKALFGTGRTDFENAVRVASAKPSYLAQLAIAMMQEKRSQSAELMLKRALADEKSNPELTSTYGLCLTKLGQSQAGFSLMQQALERMPKSIVCLENIALAYFESFESHKAEAFFSKLVELQPDNVWPLLQRAALYEERGDKKLALNDFDRALKISPKSQTIHWKRAGFFLKGKQYREALKDCQQCLEGEENVIAIRRRCLRTKVDAEERLGLYARAARDLDELNKVSIGAPRLSWGMRNDLLRQAALFERSGDYSKALATIKILEKYYPNKTEVLFLKARILGKNRQFEESLALSNYLIAKDDSLSEWHLMRAFALKGLGRSNEADAELKLAKTRSVDGGKMPDIFEYRVTK